MKKIKYFFIRQYAKIIRFLITFSSVVVLIFAQAFTSSAVTYIDCVYSQPQLTGKNCYLEIVTSKNWHWLVVVQLDAFSDATNISDVGFNAFISGDYLCIGTTAHIPTSMLLSGFRVDMDSGIMTAFEHAEAGNPSDVVRTWMGSAGSITGIHGYNCDVYDSTISATATKNSFVVNYGSDVSFRSYLRSISSYISSISMDVASYGLRCSVSMICSTPSTTTIASSTTIPMARINPSNVSIFSEKPKINMNPKVPINEIGTATTGINVARQLCKDR